MIKLTPVVLLVGAQRIQNTLDQLSDNKYCLKPPFHKPKEHNITLKQETEEKVRFTILSENKRTVISILVPNDVIKTILTAITNKEPDFHIAGLLNTMYEGTMLRLNKNPDNNLTEQPFKKDRSTIAIQNHENKNSTVVSHTTISKSTKAAYFGQLEY